MCVSAFSQVKGFMHKKTKKKRRTERQKVKKKNNMNACTAMPCENNYRYPILIAKLKR